MSRMLQFLSFAFVVTVLLLPAGIPAYGQAKPRTGRVRIAKAKPAAARQQVVSPQLRRILEEWYKNTSKIKKLEGGHWKYTYELTFAVEKRARGKFYYQAPDKGRIDIEPAKFRAGEKSRRLDSRKKPFALQADRQEKWLSTGKNIYQIDPVNKKARMFPIPDRAQGRNIMDGPLPFLLGMPPNKALARYRLSVIGDETKTEVRLQIYPRWKSDSANYKSAKVILSKTQNYLPSAVQMIDPSGNKETVYVFEKMVVNKSDLFTIFGRKWWDIDLRKYTVENMGAKPVARKSVIRKRPKNLLPNLAGYPAKDAERSLKQLGLKVEFINGRLAKTVKEVDRIESQYPGPYTKFRPGQKVTLARYVDPTVHKKGDYRVVPNLWHVDYKEAQKKLKSLGFKVELRKGSVATKSNLRYCVQYQYPLYKGKTIKGSKFILTLYVTEADLKPRKRTAARPKR